jgi:isocitrate lyase
MVDSATAAIDHEKNDLSKSGISQESIEALESEWTLDHRWSGIVRPYTAEEVLRARGTMKVEHTLAAAGSKRLWHLLETEPFVRALGALTGNQAVQQVEAGLKAIYLSGWQVAADNNLADKMYPDQSLYPANSVPTVVRKINNALRRADQVQVLDGRENGPYWFAPIVADAEAGFGGPLNAFELMTSMIEAGASGVHFEDQLSSAKKCGHMGGKVLVPTNEFVTKLVAARMAADIAGVPTVLIARTDADAAKLLTNDIDECDQKFLTGGRTAEGFYNIKGGIEQAIDRGLSYAPYADMIWCETSTPDLDDARKFADAIHAEFPGKMLSYNCSPSFNWKRNLDDATIAAFQTELSKMGYKFQFVTLAGFHSLNLGMFNLARKYSEDGMAAYARFQQKEFDYEKGSGYMATTHQKFVGTGFFDRVMESVSGGESSVSALKGSTEEAQFNGRNGNGHAG